MIRFSDILFSILGIIILLPLFLVVALVIALNSSGGVFYLQSRVGKDGKDFRLIKFRTMYTDSEKKGGLTLGARDSRTTSMGYFLRKYKLDELPQLVNVLKGDMSLVGPRPEIRKFVDSYTIDQKIVLTVKPGITDWASIEYIDENEILGRSSNPEKTYIDEVIPAKITLNRVYIENRCLKEYFRILVKTFTKILGK